MSEEGIKDQADDVFHFSSRNQRLSETVIEGLAWVKGVDPLDLDPLAEYIDPAALDVIFANTECGWLSFAVEELTVEVHPDGGVIISRPAE